jgi:hypothetical protein
VNHEPAADRKAAVAAFAGTPLERRKAPSAQKGRRQAFAGMCLRLG